MESNSQRHTCIQFPDEPVWTPEPSCGCFLPGRVEPASELSDDLDAGQRALVCAVKRGCNVGSWWRRKELLNVQTHASNGLHGFDEKASRIPEPTFYNLQSSKPFLVARLAAVRRMEAHLFLSWKSIGTGRSRMKRWVLEPLPLPEPHSQVNLQPDPCTLLTSQF